jgi:ribosomal-protein-alanine N-acetyltransferase
MSARPETPSLPVRPMRAADLTAVAALEAAVYAFPWTVGIFRDCLRAGYHCVVLQGNAALRGYGVMSVAADEAHLLNICIHPDWQRCGLGRELLNWLMTQASILGACRMYLEVRPSNRPALALYLKEGFRHIGLRSRYYRAADGREDAVVLERRLTQ